MACDSVELSLSGCFLACQSLTEKLITCNVCCHFNGIMYKSCSVCRLAEDCLLAPTACAEQYFLDVYYDYGIEHDILFNPSKSVCTICKAQSFNCFHWFSFTKIYI